MYSFIYIIFDTLNESALLTLLSNILIIKAGIISLEAYSRRKIIKTLMVSSSLASQIFRTKVSVGKKKVKGITTYSTV